jgi:hypothetical protein
MLQSYLDIISFSDNDRHEKLAYIMLAGFTHQYREFVSYMIQVIVKNFNSVLDYNLNYNGCVPQNKFIQQIPKHDIRSCTNIINFHEYCKIWVLAVLSTNKMNIIYDMYPTAPIKKHKLFIKFAEYLSIMEDYTKRQKYIELFHNHTKKIVYCDAQLYLKECMRNEVYKRMIKNRDRLDQHIRCALYGGNWDIFCKLLQSYLPHIFKNDFVSYHKTITICLLRGNHVTKYQKYLSMINKNRSHTTIPNVYEVYDYNMRVSDIFTNQSANHISLPKLSLGTFEYYLRQFNLEGGLPNSDCHIGIAAIEIYEKYLTGIPKWIKSAKMGGQYDLIKLLQGRGILSPNKN